tara:strand:- start:6042 stop:6284 length:243 start_codon:yes stop_codon:yes gene_type:complete
MKIGKINTVGLKDMHPMQVEALMELISMTINLASQTKDMGVLEDVESYCDEMVKLFGGVGVKLDVKIDTRSAGDGPQSVH